MISRCLTAVVLLLRLVTDLLLATAQLVWDVYTPRDRFRPEILDLELDGQTDAELMALTVMIGLTPGTFSIDISDDRAQMQVHALYARSDDRFLARLRERYLHPLAWVFRGVRR